MTAIEETPPNSRVRAARYCALLSIGLVAGMGIGLLVSSAWHGFQEARPKIAAHKAYMANQGRIQELMTLDKLRRLSCFVQCNDCQASVPPEKAAELVDLLVTLVCRRDVYRFEIDPKLPLAPEASLWYFTDDMHDQAGIAVDWYGSVVTVNGVRSFQVDEQIRRRIEEVLQNTKTMVEQESPDDITNAYTRTAIEGDCSR